MNTPLPDPDFAQALQLHQAGRLDEAQALYQLVLVRQPAHVDALHYFGLLQYQGGRPAEAVDWINRALALAPDQADAHSNLGLALQGLRRNDEALAAYDRAIALNPNHPQALSNRGNVLQELRHLPEAIAAYDRALALQPDFAQAHNNRGNALRALGRSEEALAAYDRALKLAPTYAEALNNRALVLQDLRRYDEAIVSCRTLMEVAPGHPYAPGMLLAARLHCCDWTHFQPLSNGIATGIERGLRVDMPLSSLWHLPTPALQRRCAELFTAAEFGGAPGLAPAARDRGHDRIRLGYASRDLQQHTVAHLVAELFEIHDRTRFEVTAISYGPDDGSALRRRLQAGVDHFVDISAMGDLEAAQDIRRREIDILVDLTGYTAGYRPALLAHRPAPIQVNYLGYPGTLGTSFHDYILADSHIAPPGSEANFVEKVVRLPDTYMVNDRKRHIAERTPARRELGLPETGFVFCSFNNSFKILPPVFDVWMRLLKAVPGSVLWLLEGNATVIVNLRREAEQRGVAGDRLVFAPRVPVEEHIARHRAADLFLDTFPYGSHTTGNDTLWAGLPMIALSGEAFAARVSGSLLKAVGLPELIAGDLAAYEALALDLARMPDRLAAVRAKLARRPELALFDTDRFRRHIEAAYQGMIDRLTGGETPASFDVPAVTSASG
ncbi:MAG TPA: tetratricopeptide repeat protein [Reyranella sp.]|nr:tetratricopeptide repeat protein [Reyranella sp.]